MAKETNIENDKTVLDGIEITIKVDIIHVLDMSIDRASVVPSILGDVPSVVHSVDFIVVFKIVLQEDID